MRQLASTTISRLSFSGRASRKRSVLAAKPICTKIPSSAISRSSLLVRSFTRMAVTWLPSPKTCVVCDDLNISMLGIVAAFSCKTVSARKVSANSSTVTWLQMPARSMAASMPELPPPTTATFFPL